MAEFTVIASEAKQSTLLPLGLDCFVAEPVIGGVHSSDPLAPRNDAVFVLAACKPRSTRSSKSK